MDIGKSSVRRPAEVQAKMNDHLYTSWFSIDEPFTDVRNNAIPTQPSMVETIVETAKVIELHLVYHLLTIMKMHMIARTATAAQMVSTRRTVEWLKVFRGVFMSSVKPQATMIPSTLVHTSHSPYSYTLLLLDV